MQSQWDVNSLLDTLAADLQCLVDPAETAMIVIFTGGVWVARALHQRLGIQTPLGVLDISFYRDDYSRAGLHPEVRASQIPFDLEGRQVILVDDVLCTGRTIRAALNEIFDYGRPERVILAVLADRGLKELPICPDAVALRLHTDPQDYLKLRGPEPLLLELAQQTGGNTA